VVTPTWSRQLATSSTWTPSNSPAATSQ
jgi:hypothetical protein